MPFQPLSLSVEALQDDAYKGIARVDGNLMKKMKLTMILK
jgi:hypothetical protein